MMKRTNVKILSIVVADYFVFIFILMIFLSACSLPWQKESIDNQVQMKTVKPELVGISSERLNRIDTLVNEYIKNKWTPGAVALIARHGKIMYHKSFGMRNIETGDSMAVSDLFRMASMTKPVTSVAIMMLYEEGKFLLDEPVSKYIPEFKDPIILDKVNLKDSSFTSHRAKSQITIRQLLTHTSGIGYGAFIQELGPIYQKAGVVDGFVVEPYILADKMKILAKMPLMHEPGEKWTYGLNTDVLGYLVEVLSGMTLNDFLTKRIFTPLGMTDTHFYIDEKDSSRLAIIYSDDGTRLAKLPMERFDYPFKGAKTYYSGGSGIISNALDYAKFAQMLANGGKFNGKQLLGRKTIELMTKNQIGNLGSFGLGFGIVDEKGSKEILSSVGNYSWSGFFSTYFWVDPKEDMIFVFLTQKYPNSHWDIEQKFHVLAYQALVD